MHELIYLDQQLLLFLNGLGNSTFDPFWLLVTGKWFWIPFYVILLYFVYKAVPRKKLIFVLIFIAIGITISDQLASVFKHGVERLRPCHEPLIMEKMRMVICGGNYGFYSAHASSSFFLVSFLSIVIGKQYKYLTFILLFWAILVSYSRIYIGVHYPMDIAFGAVVGFLLGGFLANLTKKVINKN
ncbi:phosphatase PAP2 family protein [Epilithonimonas mollis]|uniref:Undecaprenyl-diphosphatase n=1 Tax=Epilithonimonas mollis TaxID=216903 RepID=A0A1M6S9K8_9FLAO|nr:phosphatase PAP2 family protein [Epilithonimonas mollis]SHK41369.1 undecaprenyl-diphosphatase [Epilithonimonas mollis]